MPPYSLKPDASFYRKIVIGAVGARAVAADLEARGHTPKELERGATGTKIWRDVKRKRVRIPDLVCTTCGQRIEVRTKTKRELSMSHSDTDAERAWNYGMVPEDWVAFPLCGAASEDQWTAGQLAGLASYWHERTWVSWQVTSAINYLTVGGLLQTPPSKSSTKGVTEGTETSIAWDAIFSTRDGAVTGVGERGICVRRTSDGHRYTWRVAPSSTPCVSCGDSVRDNQLIACPMPVLGPAELSCTGHMRPGHIPQLLGSPERTLRFTGVKLVRLLGLEEHAEHVQQMAANPHEDPYVRLEGIAGLVALGFVDANEAFTPDLTGYDDQTRLEAVIALADAPSTSSVSLLGEILASPADYPQFMRSAAAWSLGQIGTAQAQQVLIDTFATLDDRVREEALESLVQLGDEAQAMLLEGLQHASDDVISGCAEALRQVSPSSQEMVQQLASYVQGLNADTPASHWAVWLLAHLDPAVVAPAILPLQETRPELHYAISVLWSFINSWISAHWELTPRPAHT